MCAAHEHDVLRETAGLSALSFYKSSTLALTQKEVADKRRAERMTAESLSSFFPLFLRAAALWSTGVTALTVLLPHHQFCVIASHF